MIKSYSITLGHVTQLLAGGWVDHGKLLAAYRIDEFAIDEQLTSEIDHLLLQCTLYSHAILQRSIVCVPECT